MTRTVKTCLWLLTAMGMAGAGWIMQQGVEGWAELQSPQAVAGLLMVMGAPILAWLGEHPGEAMRADQYNAGELADRRKPL